MELSEVVSKLNELAKQIKLQNDIELFVLVDRNIICNPYFSHKFLTIYKTHNFSLDDLYGYLIEIILYKYPEFKYTDITFYFIFNSIKVPPQNIILGEFKKVN